MTGPMQQILFLVVGIILLLGGGAGIVLAIPALRRRSGWDEIVLLGLLLSCGVAAGWSALGGLVRLGLLPWSVIYLGLSAVLLAAGIVAARRDRRAAPPVPGPALAIVALAAGVFVLMHFTGGALGPVHDSLDFVAFVRESLETGSLAPRSVLYQVPPDFPADPRRGSFHVQVAAICRLTGVSPVDAWRWLPRILAPAAVLAMGAVLRAWIGRRAALLATFFFFTYTLCSRDHFLQNIAYASRFGWVVGWAGLLALARGLDILRAQPPSTRIGRDAIAHLAIAAIAPLVLLPVHMLSGMQTLLALGCAGLGVLLLRDSEPRERQAVFVTGGAAALLLFPALLLRVHGTGAVANPIFDHIYGVLYVAKGMPILHPTYLLERFGITGLCATVLGLGLARVARRDRAAAFLFWSTAIPVVFLFFPPVVRLIVDAHAHSLLFRVILTIPVAGILAWCFLGAVRRLRRPGVSLLRRAPAALVVLLIAAAIAGQVADTRGEWAVPERRRAVFHENEALLNALRFIERTEAGHRRVVLSDPISSYAIPAYTSHDAVAPLHQHSSPTDPTTVQRMQDAQEVLSPRVGLARTFEVLRRYDTDLILLNQSWKRHVWSYYVFVSPLGYEETKAKFDARPDLFPLLYDADGVRVYRVNDPGPGVTLPGDPPNPARVDDPGTPALLTSGAVDLVTMTPRPGPYRLGEHVVFDVVWRRTGAPYTLPTICNLKLQDRATPASFDALFAGRIARELSEWREHRMYRVGWAYRPLAWIYPDFLWRAGETYKDEMWLHVPEICRPGDYDVWVHLGTEPYAPVATLEDVASNRLGAGWKRLMTLRVEGPAAQ